MVIKFQDRKSATGSKVSQNLIINGRLVGLETVSHIFSILIRPFHWLFYSHQFQLNIFKHITLSKTVVHAHSKQTTLSFTLCCLDRFTLLVASGVIYANLQRSKAEKYMPNLISHLEKKHIYKKEKTYLVPLCFFKILPPIAHDATK